MLDLTIRNGTIATAEETFQADVGIQGDTIAVIDASLRPGRRDVDATGKLVLPGGIDSHCHVEQLSGMGVMCADDFYSATVSAAFGGTTTIIPFAAQHRGMRIPDVLDDYARRAAEKAVVDYGFHLILTDPTEAALEHDLPAAIRSGITSFKVFMTYDTLKLDDYQLLDVFDVADREGALVMVHAENHDMIRWLAHRLVERGHKAPKYHAVAHDALAESEATYRAIQLARLVGTPVLIVHVSTTEAAAAIHAARAAGLSVHGETCPQYLFLSGDDLDRPGIEGAKYCCSPPPRGAGDQTALWSALKTGTLQMYSSDHAPFRFDASGKLPHGDATTFKQIANGVPGLEVRLPLLFSEGVGAGRITLNEFVALGATNHARTYGLYPRKGTIAVGAEADIAVWNPERRMTLSATMLHDRVGYTPYEGRTVQGWPETVVSRGRMVVDDGQLRVERGSGRYVARTTPGPIAAQRPIAVASGAGV